MRAPFLNGGTIVRNSRFYQGATSAESGRAELLKSRNGLTWHRIGAMPDPPATSWHRSQFDLSLVPRAGGFDVYFAGRPGPIGADIGVARFRSGRWGSFRRILSRQAGAWDGLDLGEPGVFQKGGRKYLLYAGLGSPGTPRHIGLAYQSSDGSWRRCARTPFIAAGGRSYRKNAIDPEPLVVGKRLYVYFGGGRVPSLGADMNGVILARVYQLDR
jgi:hypothetical protein